MTPAEFMATYFTQCATNYKYLNKHINVLILENYYDNYSFDYILNWGGLIKEIKYDT